MRRNARRALRTLEKQHCVKYPRIGGAYIVLPLPWRPTWNDIFSFSQNWSYVCEQFRRLPAAPPRRRLVAKPRTRKGGQGRADHSGVGDDDEGAIIINSFDQRIDRLLKDVYKRELRMWKGGVTLQERQ